MIIGDLAATTRMRLKAISQQQSIRAAAEAFADARLGLIVVCDDEGRASGVVSKSDLVGHLARAGHIDLPVSGVMTRTIASASPGDELRATWEWMVKRKLQNLPLLGADRRPVGTLDIRDALQTLLDIEQSHEIQLVNYIAGVGYR